MTTKEEREDRATGIGLFVRAQGRAREQAITWMRAEGFDDASAAVAWDRSAERYRALLRRFARRDVTIAACVLGSAALVTAASYLLHLGVTGYMISLALLILSGYVARNVSARRRGEPSGPDLDFQRWMRDRYPHLPAR